jgi:pimeloyl-ACP methyl ester carboxylesterase
MYLEPPDRSTGMRVTFRILIVSVLVGVAGALLGGTAAGAASRQGSTEVVKRPITFQVRNVNRSILRCAGDGAAYEVKGHLVGRASQVGPDASAQPRSATLYLHDFSFGEFFWSFSAVPGYDYAAAVARSGHVSVIVDRLGYGSSGHPQGNQTCLGAEADVAHQVVSELRAGDYVVEGGSPRPFDKVALAGHSVGALIANVEAFSFKDVDALVDMSYTPQVRQPAFEQFYESRVACGGGGEPSSQGGPGGYAYIGQTEAEFDQRSFFSAVPAVRAAVTPLRTRDPCGDSASIVDALVQDLKSLPEVKVPVLLVCGREDSVTPSFACPYLKRRYLGSSDVSLFFIRNAGHALTLERTAPSFRRRVATWLSAHGF